MVFITALAWKFLWVWKMLSDLLSKMAVNFPLQDKINFYMYGAQSSIDFLQNNFSIQTLTPHPHKNVDVSASCFPTTLIFSDDQLLFFIILWPCISLAFFLSFSFFPFFFPHCLDSFLLKTWFLSDSAKESIYNNERGEETYFLMFLSANAGILSLCWDAAT